MIGITGATGEIGGRLARRLAERGYDQRLICGIGCDVHLRSRPLPDVAMLTERGHESGVPAFLSRYMQR